MGPVIGIDLGTTNTVVAAVEGGKAAALPDSEGQILIPSVVSFHPAGEVLVGREARDRRKIDAANSIYSIKRLIGRSWDSHEVKQARGRFPFEMREGPGQAALVVARGESYTLPEISAFVLRKAKMVAEEALGTEVQRAVITVPANFNDLQRAATKVAGRVAGLEVMRILNEPTAAALAYGYGRSSSERVLVYDFGGGTLDVTALELSDNVFEVLATAGDTFLGGDDLDMAIAERMADELLADHRVDARADRGLFERLRRGAETMKQELSSAKSSRIQLTEMAYAAGGKSIDPIFTLSRPELELLAEPIVSKTFDVCREALGIARLDPQSLETVLLVGGSTRMPYVRHRVEEFFGREPVSHLSPDEVVAIGAAIQANALSGAAKRRSGLPHPPSPAARQGRKEAQGIVPTGVSARERVKTAPGLNPRSGGQHSPVAPARFVAPPAAGQPDSFQPITQDRQRAKQTTQTGIGGAPAPTTIAGLGSRGRVKTGAGLGPTPAPPPPPPPRVKAVQTHTLMSAEEEAARASHLVNEGEPRPLEKYGGLPVVMPPPSEESGAYQLDDDDLKDASFAGLLDDGASEDDELTKVKSADEDEATSVMEGLSEREAVSTRVHGTSSAHPPAETLVDATPHAATGALPTPSAPLPASLRPAAAPLPLLVDVTPLTLSVETVGGYCDVVIERNTPVPCTNTRRFATVADNQPTVRVRVSQGESTRFSENTLLGEVLLTGLRQAVRGEVQIQVRFGLDASGMLDVEAQDTATGYSVTSQIRLVGLSELGDVSAMRARQDAALAR